MAFHFAEKLTIKHTFSKEDQKAGNQWLRSFLDRNPDLSIRQAEGLSLARAKGMNREEVGNFFELLTKILTENNLIGRPGNIFNMDEAGIQIINKPSKVLAPKGAKDVHVLTSRERGENVTVIGCCNAEGTFLPPVLILKGVNKKQEFADGLPAGSSVHMNKKSSFINSQIFLYWLKEHFIPRKPAGKTILIMDGHSSHCSDVEMLELAERHDLILLCLPSHCTQAIQPLDKSFFGPLKIYWNQEAKTWMLNHPSRNLSRYQVGEILGKAWMRAATPANAISGFKGTGIYPLDQNAIPGHFFAISDGTIAREDHNAENILPYKETEEDSDEIPVTVPQRDKTPDRQSNVSTHFESNEFLIQVNEGQIPQKRNDSMEPQPNSSKNLDDDITPSKFLKEIQPIPKIPLSFSKRKQSATELTSPENIFQKKHKSELNKSKAKNKNSNKKKMEKIKTKNKKQKSDTFQSDDDDDEIPISELKKKISTKPTKSEEPDKKYFCVECFDDYNKTLKTVDWICCLRCNSWLHETCTMHLNICNPCKRNELKEKFSASLPYDN